jgi:predicted enzyme related to lactoylglutathione lyase
VTAAGGRIVEPATARADRGLFSLVVDSEGNAFHLHAAA